MHGPEYEGYNIHSMLTIPLKTKGFILYINGKNKITIFINKLTIIFLYIISLVKLDLIKIQMNIYFFELVNSNNHILLTYF